jgi:hypothetical protein
MVEAVALAGSRTTAFLDGDSDIDLYVYTTADIPLDARSEIAAGSPKAEIGNATWEPGDEWIDAETGTRMDVMYRHVRWIEEQLDRVLVQHQASVGYSTCFWYNVLHSHPLFDHTGWFAALQWSAQVRYPAGLRRAIVAKNYPLLRRNQSSYLHQVELAVKRKDPVSVNHRVTALLASYFDVLFAVNELPHPGEKRLLRHAAQCAHQPQDMVPHVLAMVEAVARPEADIGARIHRLVDGLDGLLRRKNLGEVTRD